jgi:endoglucanase
MPLSVSTFEVRDASTKSVVMTGTPKIRPVDEKNTGEQVYDLDFSSLKTPGIYYVRVPGVGISYNFRIGTDIYNEVANNALRGAYQQRASTALSSAITRFTHGPAHMDDAYVMNHNPIPSWFISRFGQKNYYSTSLSGQKINANKGHYDAGDYGKYVVNGSLFSGNILAALRTTCKFLKVETAFQISLMK